MGKPKPTEFPLSHEDAPEGEQYNQAGRRQMSRDKTAQDHMPVDQRPRKQMNDRQREWIRANRPTRSHEYLRMPR